MRQKLRSRLTYANVTATIALFVALGGTTYAATGGNFILGQSNTASSTTSLSSSGSGPALKATNTTIGTAGSFNVTAGHPPLTVNSGTKVANLNADKLDGIDSSQLKGARAYAVSGGVHCPNPPVSFCSIPRNKGVAYVARVARNDYCVGVNGISAADPNTVALPSILQSGDPDWAAEWANESGSFECAYPEFELYMTHAGGDFGFTPPEFTLVIP